MFFSFRISRWKQTCNHVFVNWNRTWSDQSTVVSTRFGLANLQLTLCLPWQRTRWSLLKIPKDYGSGYILWSGRMSPGRLLLMSAALNEFLLEGTINELLPWHLSDGRWNYAKVWHLINIGFPTLTLKMFVNSCNIKKCETELLFRLL